MIQMYVVSVVGVDREVTGFTHDIGTWNAISKGEAIRLAKDKYILECGKFTNILSANTVTVRIKK